jgi:hypothetical protein
MAITLERSPISTYPFGAFHTSLESTLCTDSELKSDLTVESVPSSVQTFEKIDGFGGTRTIRRTDNSSQENSALDSSSQ